ncbi:sugar phosphate isomerase/epimerase family protein [Kribbella kalugense]|uniref:Sugar phosphate isomerase/epimerase n=1 Tax=Kribbella kalugense TaxID=2512221 RepID=A0A4R7ZVR2_9ACTN|nr:sugar phosphate isomerase/epimerase [Kribbella kalugense]TDW21736.1 sugar phosphate isomerase/epimerase [Kribbella kalugense]
MKRPVAVQLWSVFALAEEDFPGVLRQLSEIGYDGVEAYGLHGSKPSAVRRLLKDLGLELCSSHAPFPSGPEARRVLDEQSELGAPVLAWSLEPEEFATEDSIARGVERVNDAAMNAQAYRMRIAYHNHSAEFDRLPDGRRAYDVLLDRLSPDVLVELDIYWAAAAGVDPAVVTRELGERVRFLHVKDGDPAGAMVAVGQGSLDIPAILAANPAVAWHIVELDRCDTDLMTALRESHEYLASLFV